LISLVSRRIRRPGTAGIVFSNQNETATRIRLLPLGRDVAGHDVLGFGRAFRILLAPIILGESRQRRPDNNGQYNSCSQKYNAHEATIHQPADYAASFQPPGTPSKMFPCFRSGFFGLDVGGGAAVGAGRMFGCVSAATVLLVLFTC
jgi:hypothetical protein